MILQACVMEDPQNAETHQKTKDRGNNSTRKTGEQNKNKRWMADKMEE